MRNYSSTAQPTQLAAALSTSATSLRLASVDGFPTPPFTLALDVSTPAEEIVTVTTVAGLTLTVIRGEDGTAPMPHQVGATVRHVISARDLREPAQHIDAAAGVHGLAAGDDVVGRSKYQELENKTIDATKNTIKNLTATAVANGAIGPNQIAAGAVTDAKIVNVSASKLTGTIDLARLPAIPISKVTGDVDARTIQGRTIFVQAATPTGAKAGDIWFQVI